MVKSYQLAIIGNGTTAVNALHNLVTRYENATEVLPPLTVTLFGDSPEANCGKGFAYGKIGGAIGNLTEAPNQGHADYSSTKGAFTQFASKILNVPPDEVHDSSRKLIGEFHTARYLEVKQKATNLGIEIIYQQTRVTDLTRDDAGYSVHNKDGQHHGFNKVVLAVGDVLSNRFNEASQQHVNQVFPSPYHAHRTIIANSNAETVVVAFGTRSSFLDLVNASIANGYEGKIIGVSSTGLTSWQAREGRESYPLQHMGIDKPFGTTANVLAALKKELSAAQASGVYVPASLLEAINPNQSTRLHWDFKLSEEATNANKTTYHDVSQAIPWEKIYLGLESYAEQQRFKEVLADFAVYNRVNRVVPNDYQTFVHNIESGRASIVQSSFEQTDIRKLSNGRLQVSLGNGSTIDADYVVNCAIGPASSREQAETHTLLRKLVEKSWLAPRDGSGFDVQNSHQIDLLGPQARLYPFSSLGIESYGRQIEAWGNRIIESLAQAALQPSQETSLTAWSLAYV